MTIDSPLKYASAVPYAHDGLIYDFNDPSPHTHTFTASTGNRNLQEATAMSTAQKIAEDRRQEREETRIRDLYTGYDLRPLPTATDSVVKFDRTFHVNRSRAVADRDASPTSTYTYVAFLAPDGLWYQTGKVPSGYATDEFIDLLVEAGVTRSSIVELAVVEHAVDAANDAANAAPDVTPEAAA